VVERSPSSPWDRKATVNHCRRQSSDQAFKATRRGPKMADERGIGTSCDPFHARADSFCQVQGRPVGRPSQPSGASTGWLNQRPGGARNPGLSFYDAKGRLGPAGGRGQADLPQSDLCTTLIIGEAAGSLRSGVGKNFAMALRPIAGGC